MGLRFAAMRSIIRAGAVRRPARFREIEARDMLKGLMPGRPGRRAAVGPALVLAMAVALVVAPHGAVAKEETLLVLHITDVRNDRGVVRIAVYDRPDAFPFGDAVTEAAPLAAEGIMTIQFQGLPPGRYAIAFYHDENLDHDFTRGLLGVPLEGFGFSNDAPVRLTAPSFAAAAITLEGPLLETTARMRYFR